MRRTLRAGPRYLPLLLAGLLGAGACLAVAQEIVASPDTVPTSAAGARLSAGGSSAVDPNLKLNRMILLLQPTAKQQADLDSLLAAQVTPGNALFHKWLTPEQFSRRFANSATDVAVVVAWLKRQGFAVAPLPVSRGWIEFSGTAAQVEKAFAVSVATRVEPAASTLEEAGGVRYSLQGEVKLPSSISPMVKGLVSLDGVMAETAAISPVELSQSLTSLAVVTGNAQAQALTPKLAEPWLHLEAARKDGVDGSGESIAIPSRSNLRVEDVAAFRKCFGLPEMAISVQLNGVDPGRTSEESATVLAASWAGIAAPGARIVVIPAASTNATDGLDLALAATVDGAVAHTVSVGYSACEGSMSAAHMAFYAALYRQAAAEGIAMIAATGDRGAAACHAAGDGALVSTGRGVNALASTPWNTAIGAAAFSSTAGKAGIWGQESSTDLAFATGGGASNVYATPAWQSATGLPASDPGTVAEHHRYLPDVSLPAAVDAQTSRGLAFCFAGDTANTGATDCRLMRSGGSAAAAAIFSGVAALVAEKYGPQGNLAPNLYALRRAELSNTADSAPAIIDITSGKAQLRCVSGSVNCDENSEIGFAASVGYDLASGLGSVNAGELVKKWATPQDTGTETATVEMTTIGGVTYNPTADIALSAKVISGSGGAAPTGTVQFYDETQGQNAGTPVTLATDGTATYTEDGQFSIGGHNIQAKYSGDNTYAAGVSQPITINIQPSATALVVSPSTTTPAAGSSIIVTGTVTSTNLGATPPTGSLTVNLDGIAQGTQRFTTTGTATTASMTVTAPSGGSHTIQGTYSGDINYNNSTSPSVTITVAKAATVTSIVATPSTLTAGTPESFTATIAPVSAAAGATYSITGTVSFYDGATLLGTATIGSNTAILPAISLSASLVHTITAVYSGDTSYTTSTSSPLILEPVLLPVTVVLTTSSGVLAPGQSASLAVTVTPLATPALTAEQHPSGNVFFYAGAALIGQAALGVGVGDAGVTTLLVPTLPAGAYVLTAVYVGDATYGAATSNALGLQVEDFSIACGLTNVDIVQGQTATVTCNVISSGGLTGPIQVLCGEQNPPQEGAIACSFTPNVVNGTGPTTLTIVTTGGNISRDEKKPIWPAPGGGLALAFVGLLLWPVGRRAGLLSRGVGAKMLMIALLFAGLAGAGMGCSNTVVKINNGTPLGVGTLKITAAADVNTVTVSHNAFLTVNVTP
jgi:hypothetical protein